MPDSFEKYDSYKDTNTEWLGRVPTDWEINRLASNFRERRTKVSDIDFEPLSVTKHGIVPRLESAAKSNDSENRKLVKAGDFVINSRSDRKGSSGVSPLDGSVSLINTVLKPVGIVPKFSEYLLKSNAFVEEFYRMGHGIVADLWTTRYDEMSIISLAIPSLEAQTAIAHFLDNKTEKIERAIAIKEKQIELLKERKQTLIQNAVTRGLNPDVPMKDSGVDWIGEIPAHWEVKRLKMLTQVRRGASPRPIDDQRYFDEFGEFSWVRIADVTASDHYLRHTTQRMSKLGASLSVKLQPNRLFLSIAGSVGKPMISKIKCCIHDGFVYFPNLEDGEEYLYNVFLSGTCFVGLGKHGTQLNLNTQTVGNIFVPQPSKVEKHAIVSFIQTGVKKIDDCMDNFDQQIQSLKEYKASLINSAVTGKIKVSA